MRVDLSAPSTTYIDLRHDHGLEIVVNVTQEGIIVDFFDAEHSDPYLTYARTWVQEVARLTDMLNR